jgi:hypothetical protein
LESIIVFFDAFKALYLDSFDSYKENKNVNGLFPNPVTATILGSKDGLKGFIIKDAVQFYGKWHDSGIKYEEKYDMWAGLNIDQYFENIETIEIKEQLSRYEQKADIHKSNTDFFNLVDKISERGIPIEIQRVVNLLIKFGDVRFKKMMDEQNPHRRKSFPNIILPYYNKAVETGAPLFDMSSIRIKITDVEKEL